MRTHALRIILAVALAAAPLASQVSDWGFYPNTSHWRQGETSLAAGMPTLGVRAPLILTTYPSQSGGTLDGIFILSIGVRPSPVTILPQTDWWLTGVDVVIPSSRQGIPGIWESTALVAYPKSPALAGVTIYAQAISIQRGNWSATGPIVQSSPGNVVVYGLSGAIRLRLGFAR